MEDHVLFQGESTPVQEGQRILNQGQKLTSIGRAKFVVATAIGKYRTKSHQGGLSLIPGGFKQVIERHVQWCHYSSTTCTSPQAMPL